MRFDELVLTLPGDQIRVGFHERLTVLGGLPETERTMLLASLLGAATGSAPQTELRAVDAQGCTFTWSTRGAWYEDGSPARRLVPDLLPDVAAVRAALVVSGADLGLTPGRPDLGIQAELGAAFAACTELEEELAVHGRDGEADLRIELDSIAQRLVEAEDNDARRAHHEVVSALVAARSELAIIEDLTRSADHDRARIAAAEQHRHLGGVGGDARATAANALRCADLGHVLIQRAEDGDGQHPVFVTASERSALADLGDVVETWIDAANRLAGLEADLADHRNPDESHGLDPRIRLLAPLDQDLLWSVHERVTAAEARFRRLVPERTNGVTTVPGELEADLDRAHADRLRAEQTAAQRWRPGVLGAGLIVVAAVLLASANPGLAVTMVLGAMAIAGWAILLPRRALRTAIAREGSLLDRVGAASHLGLLLRPLDGSAEATADAMQVARDQAASQMAWRNLVGQLDAAEAAGMERDVRSEALRSNAIARASREDELRAAVGTATRDRDGCRAALHRRIVALEATASAAEAEAEAAAAAQHDLLAEAGITVGEEGPLEAVSRAALEAMQRDEARAQLRRPDVVSAEIRRLDAEATTRWRPAWATLAGPPPRVPNVALMERQRQVLTARLHEIERRSRHLSNQHRTMRQRVRSLEVQLGGGRVDPDTLAQRLLARLTESRNRAGGDRSIGDLSARPDQAGAGGTFRGEPFPVVLDDTFARVPVYQRRELLEMLLRLGERIQVIYMTEDPVVVTWARQRTGTAPMTLLEFAPE